MRCLVEGDIELKIDMGNRKNFVKSLQFTIKKKESYSVKRAIVKWKRENDSAKKESNSAKSKTIVQKVKQ